MKTILLFFTVLLLNFAADIGNTYQSEIQQFQVELNESYLDKKETPLSKKQRKVFKKKGGHQFFSIDEQYRVQATLERLQDVESVTIPTSTTRMAAYDVYGKILFSLNGKDHTLNIYQSETSKASEEYKDYLFFPFTDLTSEVSTYGGGRYIDLKIPAGDRIEIDFNKAYHPYCAYSPNYSCPIPPKANFINTKIEAGVKSLNYVLK